MLKLLLPLLMMTLIAAAAANAHRLLLPLLMMAVMCSLCSRLMVLMVTVSSPGHLSAPCCLLVLRSALLAMSASMDEGRCGTSTQYGRAFVPTSVLY